MEASDYSHKIHPTPKGCIAAPETPSRYFKAFTDSGADEVAASSNKLLRSDLSVRPAPAVCFIWARCGGQKFPLFIFTPNDRVHAETQRFRAVVKSYRRSLGGSAWVQFSALFKVSLGDNGVLRSLGCHCIAILDKALKTLPLSSRRSGGGQQIQGRLASWY